MITQQTFELIGRVVSEYERDRHKIEAIIASRDQGEISINYAIQKLDPLLVPLAERFANELERTNPQFDRARFIRDCASLNGTPHTTTEDD